MLPPSLPLRASCSPSPCRSVQSIDLGEIATCFAACEVRAVDVLPHLARVLPESELHSRFLVARRQFLWADTDGDGLVSAAEAAQLCRDVRLSAAGSSALPFAEAARWLPRFVFREDFKMTQQDFIRFAAALDLAVPGALCVLNTALLLALPQAPPFELPVSVCWPAVGLGPCTFGFGSIAGGCLQVAKRHLLVPAEFAIGELVVLARLPPDPRVIRQLLAVFEDEASFYLLRDTEVEPGRLHRCLLDWMAAAHFAVPTTALWCTSWFVGRLLEAAAFLHTHHVLHLGICPDTILVRGPRDLPSSVALADAGIGGLFGSLAPPSEAALLPAAACAAPELLAGSPATASDFYSVGVVMSFLLTGRLEPPQPLPTVGAWQPSAAGAAAELASVASALCTHRASARLGKERALQRLQAVAEVLSLLPAGDVTPCMPGERLATGGAAAATAAGWARRGRVAVTPAGPDLAPLWRRVAAQELGRQAAWQRLILVLAAWPPPEGVDRLFELEGFQQPASACAVAELLARLHFDTSDLAAPALQAQLQQLQELLETVLWGLDRSALIRANVGRCCLRLASAARAFAAGSAAARSGALRVVLQRQVGGRAAVLAGPPGSAAAAAAARQEVVAHLRLGS